MELPELRMAEDGNVVRLQSVPEHLRIASSDLRTGEVIGYGSASRVLSGSWLGCEVAVKETSIHNLHAFEYYSKELEILTRLPHPYVVQVLGFVVDAEQGKLSIVMERFETSLRTVINDRISRTSPFDICEALDIATKIALGMRFLHEREIVHGFLTSDIILMNVHTDGQLDVKIGGFAFSDQASNEVKTGDVDYFSLICIEILVDWLSMSALYGGLPCKEVTEEIADIGVPPGVRDDLMKLILNCGDVDPKNRPPFSEICGRLSAIRAACDQAPKQTRVTEDCALQWTTHKDDEGNKCLEIASILESLPIHLSIDPVDVEWRRAIGAGGNNEVFEVNWLGCALAVKRFKSLLLSFKFELEFLMKLQHPHIARLIGVSVDENGGWIMMERMDTDLRKLMNSRTSSPPFSGAEELELCLKIALGLNYLHSKGVVHRDIKAANVLVHDHGGRFDVKITDFGSSHRLGSPTVAHRAGTSLWRAPEVLRAQRGELREEVLLKSDVYSFGMTCYEIVTGHAPHEHLKVNDVLEKRRPKLPAGLHPDLAGLICKCWDDDPEVRPEFSTICDVLGSIRSGSLLVPRSRVESWFSQVLRCLGLT